MTRRIRVVIGKMGLDAHDRGVRFIAKSLQNAGMEVMYVGMFQTPEAIVNTAVQEAADVIAISSLSGEHRSYVPVLMDALAKAGASEIAVIVGGLVVGEDERQLRELGVKGVYGPSASVATIVDGIRALVR